MYKMNCILTLRHVVEKLQLRLMLNYEMITLRLSRMNREDLMFMQDEYCNRSCLCWLIVHFYAANYSLRLILLRIVQTSIEGN